MDMNQNVNQKKLVCVSVCEPVWRSCCAELKQSDDPFLPWHFVCFIKPGWPCPLLPTALVSWLTCSCCFTAALWLPPPTPQVGFYIFAIKYIHTSSDGTITWVYVETFVAIAFEVIPFGYSSSERDKAVGKVAVIWIYYSTNLALDCVLSFL